MLFVVLFTDKQGCGHIRSQYSQKHIEWLETHKEVIPVGGSLRVERQSYEILHWSKANDDRKVLI
ncbi:MAG: hypothetical protein EBZ95_13580 [Chitinophagia bacterium]|nr:hypothetical protein [Chitinophagia bacterium]